MYKNIPFIILAGGTWEQYHTTSEERSLFQIVVVDPEGDDVKMTIQEYLPFIAEQVIIVSYTIEAGFIPSTGERIFLNFGHASERIDLMMLLPLFDPSQQLLDFLNAFNKWKTDSSVIRDVEHLQACICDLHIIHLMLKDQPDICKKLYDDSIRYFTYDHKIWSDLIAALARHNIKSADHLEAAYGREEAWMQCYDKQKLLSCIDIDLLNLP